MKKISLVLILCFLATAFIQAQEPISDEDHKALLEEPAKDNLSIFIGELRTLTEKRSQIKDSLHKVDDELIKLQEKIYKNKKIYEDKIAQLESINEIYSQSANIVSKIISEDKKYEQL